MVAGAVHDPPSKGVVVSQVLLATPPGKVLGFTTNSAPLSAPPLPLILMVDRSTLAPMVMGSL